MNLRLSEERAKSVKKYLADHGINSNRMATKGFGGKEPISLERDQESRAKNRRVEFVIVSG